MLDDQNEAAPAFDTGMIQCYEQLGHNIGGKHMLILPRNKFECINEIASSFPFQSNGYRCRLGS